LYRGDLLEGFFAEQGAGFEEWLDRERELLRASAARGARAVAGAMERERNYTPAVAAARRAVELADADERVMRELLQLLDRLGDRAGALQAYNSFEQRLAVDFDAKPAAETTALIERIRARATPAELEAPPLPAIPIPPRPATAPRASNGKVPEAAVPAIASTPKELSAPDPGDSSFLRTIYDRKWWLLTGALLGAAITLSITGLLVN
jgi:hypothetical protein